MIIHVGVAALYLSLILAVGSVILFAWAQITKSARVYRLGRSVVGMMVVSVTLTAGVMVFLLLTDDYSLKYVASYNTLSLPTIYKISVLWAGQAGSFLTWALVLGFFIAGMLWVDRRNKSGLMPVAFAIAVLVETVFIGLMIVSPPELDAYPFTRIEPFMENPELAMVTSRPGRIDWRLSELGQKKRDAVFRKTKKEPTYRFPQLLTLDATFRVTRATDKFLEQTGRDPLREKGLTLATLLSKDSPHTADEIAKALEQDGVWTGPVFMTRGPVRAAQERLAFWYGREALPLDKGTRMATLLQIATRPSSPADHAGHNHGSVETGGYLAAIKPLPGLNPQLRNIGMFYHPPVLLIGYAGFAIPFAFAIAALLTGRMGKEWLDLSRPFTVLSWFFLGAGNLLGALWAYEELGWGGFWAWDPVENASFMPWLVGSALLHSAIMTQRRRILRLWSIGLAILTFWLTIFGTFLTRSGFISSVHAFGESTFYITFFGLFLAICLIIPFWMVIFRFNQLRRSPRIQALTTREGLFLLVNIVMLLFTLAVLIGTMMPKLREWVGEEPKAVEREFYDNFATPVGMALLALLVVGQVSPWTKPNMQKLLKALAVPAVFGITGFALTVATFEQAFVSWQALIVITLAAAVLGGAFREFYINARRGTLLTRPRALAGFVVHIGVAMVFIGIAGPSGLELSHDGLTRTLDHDPVNNGIQVKPGATYTMTDRELKFKKPYKIQYDRVSYAYNVEEDAVIATAHLTVWRGDKIVGTLEPSSSLYYLFLDRGRAREVNMLSTVENDVYVVYDYNSVDERTHISEAGTFKFFVKPLVNWMWWGGLFFFLGSIAALWPKRKAPTEQEQAGKVSAEATTQAVSAVSK